PTLPPSPTRRSSDLHAPAIPQGAVRGARTNVNGVGMRWLVDYDNGYQVDRSTFNTWTGFNYARDFVKGHDNVGNVVFGTEPYFRSEEHTSELQSRFD